MQVDGASEVNINSEKQTVEISLNEQTDIRNVAITDVVFSEEQVRTSRSIVGVHDLSEAVEVTLSIYQDYIWTLSAKQEIERYFTVQGQIGSSEIDVANRRAVAYVSDQQDVDNIVVTSLKLGGADVSTYAPAMTQMRDFTHGIEVAVTAHGVREKWMLYVEQTTAVVEFKSVNAWTGVVWLSATGVADQDNGFKYRKQGTEEWIDVSGDDITTDGGAFSACVEALLPLTTYECYAYSGEDITEVRTFTTEEARQMPNSGFEAISNDESDKYFSFYDPSSSVVENQTKWWCTGNKGSTTVGASYSITNPDSQYVIVKFAAGNIFVGEFDGLVGTSGGTVNFGRPFTLRPRKLSLWLKYENGPIDRFNGAPDNDPVKKGDMDRCQVFVALGDWSYRDYGGTPESPVQVNTTDKSTFFNPKSENVIGYGSYITDKATDGWVKVEMPIEYNSVSRKPTHIIVSCASSMLGDYFTGSTSSKLWIDDVKLEY